MAAMRIRMQMRMRTLIVMTGRVRVPVVKRRGQRPTCCTSFY